MQPADDLIDLCIECGFCEPACPSAGLTLSPRQRIAVTREQSRLRAQDGDDRDDDLLKALEQGFVHAGMDTCAACNLCATRCPVGIETGTMILGNRQERRGSLAQYVAGFAADHTDTIEGLMGLGVGAQSLARTVIGNGVVDGIAGTLNNLTGHRLPKPSRALTNGPGIPQQPTQTKPAARGKIIYFPACASRMFGAPKTDGDFLPITEAMLALLVRAGYEPVLPTDLKGQCCGQPFLSKGFPKEAEKLGAKLHQSLETANPNSALPAVTDMSTCAKHINAHGGPIHDSAAFLVEYILPYLTITQKLPVVAVHHNCSAQHLNEQAMTETIARASADQIAVLSSVTCCGYAGDKGMFEPQLNAHALRFAKNDVPEGCSLGVSTVTTCAAGLTDHLGIPFIGLASLLEFASRPQ